MVAATGSANRRPLAPDGSRRGAVGVVLSIVLVVAGAAIFFGSGGSDLVDCVNNANGNQTAIDQCNTQFQNRNGN